MFKAGANRKELKVIEKMIDAGESAKTISSVMKIEKPVIEGFMKDLKKPTAKKGK